MDCLQKPLAWFSNFYLRVQSKIYGRNVFSILPFSIFSNFERKFFILLAKKLQKVVKTTFCVSKGTICGSKYFLKVLERNGFSPETFGMVLKFLYTCPEQKLRRNSFLIFLFRFFFGIWAKNFSDFRPKNFKKLSKLPSACPKEQFVARYNF